MPPSWPVRRRSRSPGPSARAVEGHALNNLGVDIAEMGQVDQGLDHLRTARRIAEELFEDVDDIARAIVNLVSVLLDSGRIAEAADTALEGVAVVARLGLERRKGVWCRCDAADALLRLGRWDEADRLTAQALDLEPTGVDLLRATWMRGSLSLGRGDLDEASRLLGRAHEMAARVVDEQVNGPLYADLVELHSWRGDPATALRLAAEGWERLSDHRPPFAAPLAAAAVRAAADQAAGHEPRGEMAGLATAREALGRWLARCDEVVAHDPAGGPAPRAHLRTAEAEQARADARPDPDRWDRAAASWASLDCPFRVAYARWRQAEALLARRSSRAAARQALDEAFELAARLGAGRLRQETETLGRRARLSLPVPGREDDQPVGTRLGLTPREHEVLGLLAEGLTNRQIGDRLFLSHRTVGNHVAAILAKLNTRTRSEAAAVAHREGVLDW